MKHRLWGHVRSFFSDKWGVPRQSGLDGTSVGILIPHQVDYLQQLTDEDGAFLCNQLIAMTWVFNRNNTNADWNALNKSKKPTDVVVPCGRLKAIVKPPKCSEKKNYGCLASRSPHRPNPIGLSVGRIVGYLPIDVALYRALLPQQDALPNCETPEVQNLFKALVAAPAGMPSASYSESPTVYLPLLGGMDLLDGSPIVSIEPYNVPFFVAEPSSPHWVSEGVGLASGSKVPVYFSLAAAIDLKELPNLKALKQSVVGMLSLDPRSVHSKDKHKEGLFSIVYQGLIITYKHMTSDGTSYIIVLRCRTEQTDPVLLFLDADATVLRTEKWIQAWQKLYQIDKVLTGEL